MTLAALGELGNAVDDFEATRLSLDQCLVATSFPEQARLELGELGHDVDASVRYQLIPAALDAVGSVALETARISRLPQPGASSQEQRQAFERHLRREQAVAALHGSRHHDVAGMKLRIGFKAVYFFIRAHQDMLFRVAYFTLERKFPSRGERGTMTWAAEHPTSPVGRLLAEQVPGYSVWFLGWREQRNRIKTGVGFSTFAVEDIGIGFTTFTNEGGVVGDVTNRVGLRDVARGLSLVTQLMDIVGSRP